MSLICGNEYLMLNAVEEGPLWITLLHPINPPWPPRLLPIFDGFDWMDYFMEVHLFDVKQSSLHVHFLTAATIADIIPNLPQLNIPRHSVSAVSTR